MIREFHFFDDRIVVIFVKINPFYWKNCWFWLFLSFVLTKTSILMSCISMFSAYSARWSSWTVRLLNDWTSNIFFVNLSTNTIRKNDIWNIFFFDFEMMQKFILKWWYCFDFCKIEIITKNVICQNNCQQKQYWVRE